MGLALESAGLPEADFRLRLVPQGEGSAALELHLLEKDAERLPPALRGELPSLVARAAPALPGPARLAAQGTLSGFFDKRTEFPHSH